MRRDFRALSTVGAIVAIAFILIVPAAEAHWCDDLWASSYNITVKPETAVVTVPESGEATLYVYVQNNMHWPLPDPNFTATADGDVRVTASLADTYNRPGSFMPGETLKYALGISKPGGGKVRAVDLVFAFGFDGYQGSCYPNIEGKSTVVVNPDGTTTPTPDLGSTACKSLMSTDLVYAAYADFDTPTGIQKLMDLYCAGRASWGSPRYCAGLSTECPTERGSGNGDKLEHPRMSAIIELAARKAALGARLDTVRARARCGVADDDDTFAGLALFALGYLGDEARARAFMRALVGDARLGLMAKAALYVAGNPSDKSALREDVRAGLKSNNFHAKMACAAALGIADKDDDAVKTVLMEGAQWEEPDKDTSALYASLLLALTAWDRRGWAPNGNDRCGVSFYGDPAFPGACGRGTAGAGGAGGGGGSTVDQGGTAAGAADGCGCQLGARANIRHRVSVLTLAALCFLARPRRRAASRRIRT